MVFWALTQKICPCGRDLERSTRNSSPSLLRRRRQPHGCGATSRCRMGCPPTWSHTQLRQRLRSSISCSHRSEEHTSELQSRLHLVCRLLLEKKKKCTSPVLMTASSTE